VLIGNAQLTGRNLDFPQGTPLIAAIRPVDVVPHKAGFQQDGTGENFLDATIEEMEFLGSFWRSRLRSAELGEQDLTADFSINAVRRLSLESGGAMVVELPPERLLTFPSGGSHGAHS